MRFAAIIVAIGTGVYLSWLASVFLAEVLEPPRDAYDTSEGPVGLVVLLVLSVLVLAAATVGLIMRQAWAAFVVSTGAFVGSAVFGLIALVMPLSAASPYYVGDPPSSLPWIVASILAIGFGLATRRLGNSMRRAAEPG